MRKRRQRFEQAYGDAGFSQEALAAKLQVSREAISLWVNCKHDPHAYYRHKIREIFPDWDIEELLAITEVPDDEEESSSLFVPHNPLKDALMRRSPIRFYLIAHTDYLSIHEIISSIEEAIKDMKTMGDEITRREALCELASIPLITMGQSQTLKASRYEEMLRYCAAALPGCWELHRGDSSQGRQHAYQCVCTYVPLLEMIAYDSPRLSGQALDLATRYALIKTLMSWTLAKPIDAVGNAQHALSLSSETGNISLQLSARTKLTWTYLRNKNYVMGWKVMQEGEHIIKAYQRSKKGPLLPSGMIGNFNSSYALAQVHNGIDPDRALGIAADSEPLMKRIAFVEFTVPDQLFEAAKVYSLKGDAGQALQRLEKLIDTETLSLLPSIDLSERERLYALNIMTQSLLQLPERDMAHIIRTWEVVMGGAQEGRDEVMYDEAMNNFIAMRTLYPTEQAIRRIAPLTSHW